MGYSVIIWYMYTICKIKAKYLLNYVYSSFIHNRQKLETTYMPLNQRMDKENMVHLYTGVLLSCFKKH